MAPTRLVHPGPISRRRFLSVSAGLAGGLVLTGCAGSAPRPSARRDDDRDHDGPHAVAPERPDGGVLRIATWPGYIDTDDDGGHPSLARFEAETGITVDYQEIIEDDIEFYRKELHEDLEAGRPAAWDIAVLADSMVERLLSLGYLEPLAAPWMTRFPANLETRYRNRSWDPSNVWAAPWQSGMTGLTFDRAVTGDLEDVAVLFSRGLAGRIGLVNDARDVVGLAALSLGVDPAVMDQSCFEHALGVVGKAIDGGWARIVEGGRYPEFLLDGSVAVTSGWSGDLATLLLPEAHGGQDFRWVLPRQGGMLWTDNLCIPRGARNRAQAMAFIDWAYEPRNAAQIEAWVNYVCPVAGAAREIVAIDASLAANTFIFPTPDMWSRLREFRSRDLQSDLAWEAAFARLVPPDLD